MLARLNSLPCTLEKQGCLVSAVLGESLPGAHLRAGSGHSSWWLEDGAGILAQAEFLHKVIELGCRSTLLLQCNSVSSSGCKIY